MQSKQRTLELLAAQLPDADERRALEKKAEIASWVTGSVVYSSASGQLREEMDDKVWQRCTKDVLKCLDAVGKAISIEEKVSYPYPHPHPHPNSKPKPKPKANPKPNQGGAAADEAVRRLFAAALPAADPEPGQQQAQAHVRGALLEGRGPLL